MQRIELFLAEHEYFQGLNEAQLVAIARLGTLVKLGRGEILALEGDPCTSIFFVVEGRVQALKMSPQGREQVLSELKAGESFYLVPALDGGPLPTTTRTATRATLLSFRSADFIALLNHYPMLAMRVLVDFARRLRHMSVLVENLSLRSVPERLARLLLEHVASPESHHMTQREMAAQLGTVREVVARTLLSFEREGIIRLSRGVIDILDLEALQRLALG